VAAVSDKEKYWEALKAYYHNIGQRRTEARGILLELALHGRGRVGTLAREALAADGVTVNRSRAGA
jgi:hypothetical protein